MSLSLPLYLEYISLFLKLVMKPFIWSCIAMSWKMEKMLLECLRLCLKASRASQVYLEWFCWSGAKQFGSGQKRVR